MTNHASRLGTIVAVAMMVGACDGGGKAADLFTHHARTTLLLIDTSGSISAKDRSIYGQSLSAAANTFQPGDRVVLADIGDEDRGGFRPVLDITVPDSDVRLDREEAVAAARAQFNKVVPALLPEDGRHGTRSTLILASIAAGAQAFGAAPHEGDRLIILSDGVEEGPVVNLAKGRHDPAAISEEIDEARKAGLLPALGGVEMTVAGAGGADYVGIEQFWHRYAVATHAHLVAYGRLPFRP